MIVLNPGVDEKRLSRTLDEINDDLQRLATITGTLNTDMGVRIDTSGERMHIVDSQGNSVPQMQVLAVLASLTFQQHESAVVAVPVDAPSIFESLASQHSGRR